MWSSYRASTSLFSTSPFPVCACFLCYCWHCGETRQHSWETDLFVSHSVAHIAGMRKRGRRRRLGLLLFAFSICLLVQKQLSSGRIETGRHWVSSLHVPSALPAEAAAAGSCGTAPLPVWTFWQARTLTDTSNWHCNCTASILNASLFSKTTIVSYIQIETCFTPLQNICCIVFVLFGTASSAL